MKGYGDILVFSRTIPVLVDGRGGRIGREGQGTKKISVQGQIIKFNGNRAKKLSSTFFFRAEELIWSCIIHQFRSPD